MTVPRIFAAIVAVVAVAVALSGAQSGRGQRRWVMYEHEMQDPVDDPPDAWGETEFAFARLRFRGKMPAWRQASCPQAAPKKRTFHVLIHPDISCATDTHQDVRLTHGCGKRMVVRQERDGSRIPDRPYELWQGRI